MPPLASFTSSSSGAVRRRVVVTGAAGFIGSVLVRRLAADGWGVVAVDRMGTDRRFQNLAGVPLEDYWDADDWLGRMEAGKPLPSCHAVLHLGACSDTAESDVGFLLRNNFAYSRSLALWCLNSGRRFIYASSAATYGDGAQGFSDQLELLPRLAPRNAYAFSKHLFDQWALGHGAFRGSGGITGLKYFNVFGPQEAHKGAMRSMVIKAYEQIQTAGRICLFRSTDPAAEDGGQRRDFLHVDDAVAYTTWILEHPAIAGIFNIGSGVARSWNDLAKAVFSALGLPPRIEYVDMPAALRASYQNYTCADMGQLRAQGCLLVARSLEQGVDEYLALYHPPRPASGQGGGA